MNLKQEPEQPAQFAFRIVEASGNNVWYVAIVESTMVETVLREIVTTVNELQAEAAAVVKVDSPFAFERAVYTSTHRILIGWGFEQFDEAEWGTLDRARTRLMRAPAQPTDIDSTIMVLVLSAAAFATLQSSAPNLVSWIGGSVFEVAAEKSLSSADRELRLEELRHWGAMTDADVIQRATNGTLPPEPYFAEWLVLLGKGDLLVDN